jgi:hypothetical protein
MKLLVTRKLPTLDLTLKKQKSLKANAQGQCKIDTTDLRLKGSPAGNSTLTISWVSCFKATFVVNQILVIRINPLANGC